MPGMGEPPPGARRGQGSGGGTPTQAHGWRGLERTQGATTRAVGRPLTGEAEREGCFCLTLFRLTARSSLRGKADSFVARFCIAMASTHSH